MSSSEHVPVGEVSPAVKVEVAHRRAARAVSDDDIIDPPLIEPMGDKETHVVSRRGARAGAVHNAVAIHVTVDEIQVCDVIVFGAQIDVTVVRTASYHAGD